MQVQKLDISLIQMQSRLILIGTPIVSLLVFLQALHSKLIKIQNWMFGIQQI